MSDIILLIQWSCCNLIRLPVFVCVYLLTYHRCSDIPLVTFDNGYFTAGAVIDLVNLCIYALCFILAEVGCYFKYWKLLIPFCCYAVCDFIFSVLLACRDRNFILPYFGQVNMFICISIVVFLLVCKIYHFVVACIIMVRDKRETDIYPSPSSLPPPSPLLSYNKNI